MRLTWVRSTVRNPLCGVVLVLGVFVLFHFVLLGGREDKGYLYIALTIPELILNIRLAPKAELSACTKEMLEMGPADGSTVPKVCSPRRELQDAFQLSHFFTYSVYLL